MLNVDVPLGGGDMISTRRRPLPAPAGLVPGRRDGRSDGAARATAAGLRELYDDVLMADLMRAYYGGDLYNVGWWPPGATSQGEASVCLVRRVNAQLRFEPRRILEVGCGLGGSTREIARSWPAAELTAIGVSDRQLARCRALLPALRFVRMDAGRLAFPSGQFDAVIAVEAALHVDPRTAFFGEAHRVLDVGGQLVLGDLLVPSADWPGAWSSPAANIGCDPSTYARQLEQAGFRDVAVEDVTAQTWDVHVAQFGRFVREGAAGQTASTWQAAARALADAPRPIYVIASAVRR
jgi:SAM-dependent methyltransferase